MQKVEQKQDATFRTRITHIFHGQTGAARLAIKRRRVADFVDHKGNAASVLAMLDAYEAQRFYLTRDLPDALHSFPTVLVDLVRDYVGPLPLRPIVWRVSKVALSSCTFTLYPKRWAFHRRRAGFGPSSTYITLRAPCAHDTITVADVSRWLAEHSTACKARGTSLALYSNDVDRMYDSFFSLRRLRPLKTERKQQNKQQKKKQLVELPLPRDIVLFLTKHIFKHLPAGACSLAFKCGRFMYTAVMPTAICYSRHMLAP
jgi:hypothetical protein